MSDKHLKLKYRPGASDNMVEINGAELKNAVAGVSIRIVAGGMPAIELTFSLFSCEVDTDGGVSVNAVPVTDEIGREIYQKLKRRYEER